MALVSRKKINFDPFEDFLKEDGVLLRQPLVRKSNDIESRMVRFWKYRNIRRLNVYRHLGQLLLAQRYMNK